MNVLFVTDVPCWRPGRGSGRRIASLIHHLQRRHRVSVCFIGNLPAAEWKTAAATLGVALHGPGKSHRAARMLQSVQALLHRTVQVPRPGATAAEPQVRTLESFFSPVIGQYVKDLVARIEADVVVIEYVSLAWIAGYVRTASRRCRFALDTHDIMHLRNQESRRLGLPVWLDVDREQERQAMQEMDAIIAISDEDQQKLQEMLPGKTIVLAPCAAGHFSAGHVENPGSWTNKKNESFEPVVVGFIGSDAAANHHGLQWFLERVWPHVVEHQGNNVRLRIAGPLDRAALLARVSPPNGAGIEWVGAVRDLTDFYQAVDIAINPVFLQSGFKIKSMEALSHGVPLVSTAAGLAGLSRTIGRGALLAEDDEGFVTHLLRLVEDGELRREMSEHAVQVMKAHFRPDAAYAQLDAWIAEEP